MKLTITNGKIDNNSLISIIVPLYNNERFIGNCIESFLGQTYKNFELIIIDDGSTDNSFAKAKEYEQVDKRVKCYHADKKGVSAARNQGLDLSNGEYVCFIDSDDYVSKYYLECLLSAIKHTGSDISVVGWKIMPESQPDNFKGKFNPSKYKAQVYDRLSATEILFSGKKMRMSSVNKMYKKSILLSGNVRFREEFLHCEDVVFAYQAYLYANKVCFIPFNYYGYTKRKGSAVHSKINPKKLTSLAAVKFAAERCEKEFPEAYTHVAGWQVLVNIEMLYCMYHDKYYDNDVYTDICKTFDEKMKFVRKGKRNYLYRRMFAWLGGWLLVKFYKKRFKKQMLTEKAQEEQKAA